MQHVAQMLMMKLITGWFWCWKRLGMHKKYAHTQAVLESTWELGLWPVTGDEKILLGPL